MNLPTGAVTFLFTDIEGSTKLWEAQPDAMQIALERHDTILREVIARDNGYLFKTVGDAFCAAFHSAADGLSAALCAHLALQNQIWDEKTGPLRVRIGLHTGEARERDNDYFGPTLNRTARLQAVAHGQQTLLSQATYQLVAGQIPDGCHFTDLGMHRLKDLGTPEHVWQLNHIGIPSEFGPLKTLDYLPTNLPRQLTSFIGREKELKEVDQLLRKTSLLTLTGSGGTGKTRLSLQAAAEVIDEYQDGVWLVEFGAITDADLVPQTVAHAMSIREAPDEPISKTLLSALKDKQTLLVLDNCEHLLSATAQLTDAILHGCPRVKVVVSSREHLGITGEQSYRVPSLSLPDTRKLHTTESLMHYESVRLFIDRASAARADFTVTSDNASSLASLCERLDGIPLAIELAAVRVRSMTVEEINRRLGDCFRILTGGSKTALPRQQTLKSMIDWSYNLLTEQEQALLPRLSVFAGGWTVEAAEAVCASDAPSPSSTEGRKNKTVALHPDDILDLHASLVDKSLIVAESRGDASRYRLLETIRQYGRDRLGERGEGTEARTRHLDHFLAIAEEAELQSTGREQAKWLNKLETEHDNLRAALEWSLRPMEEKATGAPLQQLAPNAEHYALRLTSSLRGFWQVRGHVFEGRAWSERALDAEADAPPALRAKALYAAACLAIDQGDYAPAQKLHEQSLRISREIGDQNRIAYALMGVGAVAKGMSNYDEARTYFEESLALRRVAGNQTGISAALTSLGIVAHRQGDYATARAKFEESLGIAQELGNRGATATILTNLACIANEQNDYATARALHEEGLAIMREFGDREGISYSLHNLGEVAEGEGDYAAAQSLFTESLSLARELGLTPTIAASLGAFASLAAARHEPRLAAILWGSAEAVLRKIGLALSPVELEFRFNRLASAREALGTDAFAAAWAEGGTMTMDEACEYALNTCKR